MSIKHALLALLTERPRHGYQLKTAFEARTGGTWPLNVGQVYTTLQRLERDGLVTGDGPAADGTVTYRPTVAGQEEVATWWAVPVDRGAPARDELAIKVALAVTSDGVDAAALVQRQRVETLRTLQRLTRAKSRLADEAAAREGSVGTDSAWLLVLDRLIFDADAEARWLDHVERTAVTPRTRQPRPAGHPAGATRPDDTPPRADAPEPGVLR